MESQHAHIFLFEHDLRANVSRVCRKEKSRLPLFRIKLRLRAFSHDVELCSESS